MNHDSAVPTTPDGNWPLPSTIPPVPPGAPARRALVLGGGGAAGNAWEIGLIAGLFAGGVDLTTADLIVGTSAGATAAAQLTGGPSPADLHAAILDEHWPVPTGPTPVPHAAAQTYLDWSDAIIAASADASDMRRRLGEASISLSDRDADDQRRWREIVARRLPATSWPRQRVLITAIDADTGEPVAFDGDSGVDLVDAVAASTSTGFGMTGPYVIGGRRFLDGGYRRSENADLASGHDAVIVLAPFGGRSRMPAAWRMDLGTQKAELLAEGSAVLTLVPPPEVRDIFDANAADPANRRRAAEAGYASGLRDARSVEDVWEVPR